MFVSGHDESPKKEYEEMTNGNVLPVSADAQTHRDIHTHTHTHAGIHMHTSNRAGTSVRHRSSGLVKR